MAKRMLDCFTSDFVQFSKTDLLKASALSEGRTLACETIGTFQPMLGNVTNAEFVCSLGTDLILLNLFDVNQPIIQGLPHCAPEDTVRELKRLTGRPVGINLEPADIGSDSQWAMTAGRRATVENARRAQAMGVDLILLTGNPGMGVTNEGILEAVSLFRDAVGSRIALAAGKMHAAGELRSGPILTTEEAEAFLDAGADILLFPAPGTVPGMTQELAKALADCAHARGKLAMSAIGTSQEGADTQTIRSIALMCKMAGVDIHHIGDTGYGGMALPENIFSYSVAIRGIRHTYHRMASSVVR